MKRKSSYICVSRFIFCKVIAKLRENWARFDKGFLIVLGIAFLAILPFLSRSSLPEKTDAELHIFRLYELSLLVRGGEFYPRWAPDFYHGYGYPIFNYYAPLTYYLGLVIELMPRLDAVAGVKAVFILGLLLGPIGIYGFVRDNWGKWGGYAAAASFVYAPYILYIDPHARGVLPESFSFGVFPLALWSLDRVRRGSGRWWFITAVITTSAVILSHNLMGLLFYCLLFGWAVWHLIYSPNKNVLKQRRFLTVTALLLGLGSAAFFWLPVFLEREAVNLNTLLGAGDNYDFHTHFLSWSELLAFARRLDWGATQPEFVFNLGFPQWLFGGLGLIALILGRVKRAYHLTFFGISLGLLIFMMLPISAAIWESIPLLPFFQFPWRLLGAAVTMLAILAGAGLASILDGLAIKVSSHKYPRVIGWVTAVFVIVPIAFAWPLTQPAPWPEFGDVFLGRLSEIELKGRWLGTTSTSDYVPATVDSIPSRQGGVVAPLYEEKPPDWVNWATIPDGVSVETEVITPLFKRYEIESEKKFLFRLFLFDFPGWQVRVDGEPTEKELGRPEGFIVIPLAAGRHTVDVEFGSTPARNLSWFITGISLLLTGLLAWQLPNGSSFQVQSSSFQANRLIAVAVVVMTAVTLLIIHPSGIFHYDSRNFIAEPAETAVFVDFGDQIALIGYDISTGTASPGDTITVSAYWQAKQKMNINYQVFIHILNADGQLVAQSDKINPGDFPTRNWPLEKYVRDTHQVNLPLEMPAGNYRISVGLWVQTEGWRLPILDEKGMQIADNFVMSSLTIE